MYLSMPAAATWSSPFLVGLIRLIGLNSQNRGGAMDRPARGDNC